MRGDEIFDALTDIDDELIECAMNYYPQKKKNMRLAAGIKLKAVVNIAAAMIIVCIGAFVYNNTIHDAVVAILKDSIGSPVNECTGASWPIVETETLQTGIASGTDTESNGGVTDEAKYAYEFTAQSDVYVRIGEYEGMSVLMLSEELSTELETYSIYVEKDDEIVPAEDAALSEEQLLQIQKMAAEYCENNR